MRARTVLTAVLTLSVCLAQGRPAAAQGATTSEAECQRLRQRLAGHAALSEGVRRALAAQAAAAPAVPAPAPSKPAATGRAEAIRARLDQITSERRTLEEQRLGAMVRFDLTRASQIQAQIQALDAEKATLEREQAALPAGAATTPAVAAPAAPADPVARIACKDLPAALESALRTRRRELGAREEQAGAVPLVALRGQTAEQIGQELAAQLPSGSPVVGLFDADGDGRLDGLVDVPAPGVFRLMRQRADGTVSLESFPAGPGAPGYGEMTRRLDEAAGRQTGQALGDLLATRPAGPVRTTQTAEFGAAYAQFQAGSFAEAARLAGPAARSTEFQNLRGQGVRVLEVVSPVAGGVSLQRVVVLAQPNEQELWEETTTVVRPASYWRTDVEVARARETRAASGALVGTRSSPAPVKFSLER